MTVHAPSPVYPPTLDYPSPAPESTPSRSQRMLLATLRRADAQSTPQESDYFSRAMDKAVSRSNSLNASPARSHHALNSRAASPQTRRGRSPSPPPHLSRNQTLPAMKRKLEGTDVPMGRSRGPSFTHPSTVTGDQWSWPSPRRTPAPLRTASSTQLAPTSMNTAMITPPPSPPHCRPGRIGIGAPPAPPSSSRSSSTTPPTTTFDARSVSEALKSQNGYVSFCDIEGLGEPEGMDGEEHEEGDDDEQGRGSKWWELWK